MKVEAIPGEPFRYHIGSRSTGGTHMVDLAEGACACIGWTTRQKAYKKLTGKDYECAHVKAAWQQLKDDIKAKYGKPSPLPLKPATTNRGCSEPSGKA